MELNAEMNMVMSERFTSWCDGGQTVGPPNEIEHFDDARTSP